VAEKSILTTKHQVDNRLCFFHENPFHSFVKYIFLLYRKLIQLKLFESVWYSCGFCCKSTKTEWHKLINVSARCERKIITTIIDLPTRSVSLFVVKRRPLFDIPREREREGGGRERGRGRGRGEREVQERGTQYIIFFSPSAASRLATKDSGRDRDPYMLSTSLIYVHQFRARRPRVRRVVKNFNARRISSILPSLRSILNAMS